MNAVDRSDQILATNNVLRKCMRWWKTLFFHLIDIAIVNSFILFREHQAKNPDDEALHRPRDYSLSSFREEIVRQLCGFTEYENAPSGSKLKEGPPPGDFETLHIPEYSELRKRCVVCYKQGVDLKVQSYCSRPKCEGKYMHVATKDKDCFRVFHSREFQSSK